MMNNYDMLLSTSFAVTFSAHKHKQKNNTQNMHPIFGTQRLCSLTSSLPASTHRARHRSDWGVTTINFPCDSDVTFICTALICVPTCSTVSRWDKCSKISTVLIEKTLICSLWMENGNDLTKYTVRACPTASFCDLGRQCYVLPYRNIALIQNHVHTVHTVLTPQTYL